ncbi:MAG: 2-succinyl-5-enolpyruvyl-6-hydroxy-3-cyclohexene-1-carboxylic-acid synthase [Myxococcaceae bacterium]|nr:2-succinyl-5-enolpyruvyl-6-hydroxy-3-cyclohexene-1-carboxylic-acid synthase [Myxococcaceae bacterium]
MTGPQLTYAWAATLADLLVRAGVKHVAVCPGSRSAPLALAFAERRELKLWPLPDERSAAFFALGVGMATATPAAVVVTSGTAGANAYPAVIEAAMAHVPLVVITANRPPELHGFGALQTIEQHRLFGGYAQFVPLAVPEAATAPHLRATVARALAAGGVLHVDVPFREPLALPPGDAMPAPFAGSEHFAVTRPALPDVAAAAQLLASRTVIVAGPGRYVPQVAALAEKLGAPIFAEASSGYRFGEGSKYAVAHYDALLRAEAGEKPQLVIRVGGPLTTRTLQAFADVCPVLVIAEPGRVCDPNHAARCVLEGDTALIADALAARAPAADTSFLTRWLELDARAAAAIDGTLEGEPAFARALVAALPPDANLMLSNSMPIRDVDAFASRSARHLNVFSSRGASGIDGVTSTAFGIAAATGKKTALLIGDTALLHDLGGLVWGARLKVSLCVAAVNNDGGRIFEFLPVAQSTSSLAELFVMPPNVELRHAAAVAGASWHTTRDTAGLERAVRDALEGGVHLVEADARGRDVAEDHRRAWALVREATR